MKELVTFEFRYNDKPENKDLSQYKSKTVTIGVFDTIEEAFEEGNKALNNLKESFNFYNGDCFKKKVLFGRVFDERLVSCSKKNMGIDVYCKITQLSYDDLQATMDETFAAFERYKSYRDSERD